MTKEELFEAIDLIIFTEKSRFDIYAEHDQIWIGGEEKSKNDARLDELGWFWDEESWSRFA